MYSVEALLQQLHQTQSIQKIEELQQQEEVICTKLTCINEELEAWTENWKRTKKQRMNHTTNNFSKLSQQFLQHHHQLNLLLIMKTPLVYDCKCSCKFKTTDEQKYISHFSLHQRRKVLVKGKSMVSYLGNIVPVNCVGEEGKLHDEIRFVGSSQEQGMEEDKGQREDRQEEYYCGCGRSFCTYFKYVKHMSSHGWKIPENSSHIIHRQRNTPCSHPYAVKQDNPKPLKCPCTSKTFTHEEFVRHVFKFHKGYLPLI